MRGLGWILAFFIAIIAVGAFTFGFSVRDAFGDPNHGVCSSGVTSIESSADLVTYDAGTNIVDGVCLKAGNTEKHTFFDADVTTECYAISGIGTSAVTVTRLGEGRECQGISHIDVTLRSPTPTPTPTPTETPTPTPTNTPTPTPTSTPLPTPTPDATPTPTLTPVATSALQAPAAFPDTGGEPAGLPNAGVGAFAADGGSCRDWTTGQAGDSSTPCQSGGSNYAGTLAIVSILLAVTGLVALAFWALFRGW